ncbi:MAG TPA: hypothetical protein ENJ95_14060 [Bacteroidetes bacterium]|nr:hypothetical protein [Bacteroidota bacterium]
MKSKLLFSLLLLSILFVKCKPDDDSPSMFDPETEVYTLVVEKVDVDPRNLHLATVNLTNGHIEEFSDQNIYMTGLSGDKGFQASDLEGGRYFLARGYDLLTIDLETGVTLFDKNVGHFRGVQYNDKTKKLYGIFLNLSSPNSDETNIISEINPETGDTTLVGYWPYANILGTYQDIDTDNNRLLAYEPSQEILYSIDLSSGEISSASVPSLKGLQFNPNNGQIYGIEQLANESGFMLVAIDIQTGQKNQLFSLPFKSIQSEGVQAIHPQSNSYIIWAWDNDDVLRLFSIDLTTGETNYQPKVNRNLWGIQN